ncbi:hypothetical protein CONCODRAFT_67823 [Conidiobolus coronatus NRRL 28638]|uniref:Attractin/MKLN-like beta-propeller domain-containing protein n=1 Tax=Conidiobolus coronatus (strain ATCC 28846 / CBS 209.66 / NRRL 28638) TaxID=796925 RepID=A0A137PGD4_CONC2|nr:hypothetical protein CONCODRAFT_67823 [Conidiobolus coronatus NRRL 28638]|eukprot:KXN74052.1 hypothetical protein CONCODRAFT_67823 [Conidiobolus coronatus NRRL 28638]
MINFKLSLGVLSLVLSSVNPQLIGGACSIVNTSMFFTGGANGNTGTPSNNIYDIDLTATFGVAEANSQLKGFQLPSNARLPVFGAVFNPTLNGTTIYVYGGNQNNATLSNNGSPISGQGVDQFNLMTGEWTRGNQANPPLLRESFAWMTAPTGVYIFGGRITNTNQLSNELWTYNVAKNDWTQLANSPDVPAMRYTTGVRINDTLIIFPGVGDDGIVKDLTTVYVYTISTNTWRVQPTTRSGRRQVIKYKPIAYKNLVLIQGGVNNLNSTSSNFTAWDDLLALDTNSWSFTNYKLDSDYGSTNRIGYGAWAIGDQLVQFFGEPSPTQQASGGANFNPMQVIDLKTFQAVPTYKPPPPNFFTSNVSITLQQHHGLSTGAIVGIVFGIIGLLLIIIGVVFFYRRKLRNLREELSPPEYFGGERTSKHMSKNIANDNGIVWATPEDVPNKPGTNRNTLVSNTDINSTGGTLASTGSGAQKNDMDQRIFSLEETQLAPDELNHRFES